MKYFDLVPVGQLVTRSVSDIESIARIFSQGLFMIISDLMKMVVVLCFMFYMNWQLTWIVVVAMPVLVFITDISTQDASGFWDVRKNFKHEFLRARTRNWNEDFTVV
jgi:ABC-type bacteriocin/lantibiotic exporter with double-glycine peptidase domain